MVEPCGLSKICENSWVVSQRELQFIAQKNPLCKSRTSIIANGMPPHSKAAAWQSSADQRSTWFPRGSGGGGTQSRGAADSRGRAVHVGGCNWRPPRSRRCRGGGNPPVGAHSLVCRRHLRQVLRHRHRCRHRGESSPFPVRLRDYLSLSGCKPAWSLTASVRCSLVVLGSGGADVAYQYQDDFELQVLACMHLMYIRAPNL